MAVDRPRAGRRLAGDQVEVAALLVGEAERAGERRQHLRRGVGGAALLEPREVVDGEPGEARQLLAAQARGASPGTGREAGRGRVEPVAPGPDAVAELVALHPPSIALRGRRAGAKVALSFPGSGRPLWRARREAHDRA